MTVLGQPRWVRHLPSSGTAPQAPALPCGHRSRSSRGAAVDECTAGGDIAVRAARAEQPSPRAQLSPALPCLCHRRLLHGLYHLCLRCSCWPLQGLEPSAQSRELGVFAALWHAVGDAGSPRCTTRSFCVPFPARAREGTRLRAFQQNYTSMGLTPAVVWLTWFRDFLVSLMRPCHERCCPLSLVSREAVSGTGGEDRSFRCSCHRRAGPKFPAWSGHGHFAACPPPDPRQE